MKNDDDFEDELDFSKLDSTAFLSIFAFFCVENCATAF